MLLTQIYLINYQTRYLNSLEMTYNVQRTERLFCAGEGEGVVVDDVVDDDDPVSSPLSDYKQ